MLIRERAGLPPLKLPATAKQTGPKGGAKSYFLAKIAALQLPSV